MNTEEKSPQIPPINTKAVLARIGDDENFLNELIETFYKDYKTKKAMLKKAIAAKNFSDIQKISHSIKGASSNLSLPGIQQVAKKMESSGKERDIKGAKKNLASLETEVNRLRTFIVHKFG